METSKLIIYCIFVCINSVVLFLIYSAISRWMKRTETKINKLEHIVRSTDDYIRYTKHTTDVVYLNYLDGLLRILISKERFEDAEKISKTIAIVEARMMEDMRDIERKESAKMFEEDLDRMWYSWKNQYPKKGKNGNEPENLGESNKDTGK